MRTPESQQEIALKNLERAEAREARMAWAGSVANGAVLIALIGLIGNVPNPDAAAMFFRWAILWLGVGVFFGGGCAYAFTCTGRLILRWSAAAVDAARAESFFREGKTEFAVRAAIQAVVTLIDAEKTDNDLGISRVNFVEDFSKLSKFYGEQLVRIYRIRKIWKIAGDSFFFSSFLCLAIAGGIAIGCYASGYRMQP